MNARPLRHTRGYRYGKAVDGPRMPITPVTLATSGKSLVLRSPMRLGGGMTWVDIQIMWADFGALAEAMAAADRDVAREAFTATLENESG